MQEKMSEKEKGTLQGSRFDRARSSFISLTAAFSLLNTLNPEAAAETKFITNGEDGSIEMFYSDKENPSPVRIRSIPVSEIGTAITTERVSINLLDKISKSTIVFGDVNYTLSDPERFNTYAFNEFNRTKKKLSLSEKTLAPKDFITIVLRMTAESVPYQHNMVETARNYSPLLRKMIASTPIDSNIIYRAGGVCQNQTAAFILFADTLKASGRFKELTNIYFVPEVLPDAPDQGHARVGVYEGVTKNGMPCINFSEVDPTNHHDTSKEGRGLYSAYSNQLEQFLTPEERVDYSISYLSQRKNDISEKFWYVIMTDLIFSFVSSVSPGQGEVRQPLSLFFFNKTEAKIRSFFNDFAGDKKAGSYHTLRSIFSKAYQNAAENMPNYRDKIAILERGSDFNVTFARDIARLSKEYGDIDSAQKWYLIYAKAWNEPAAYEEAFLFFRAINNKEGVDDILHQFENALSAFPASEQKNARRIIAELYKKSGDDEKYEFYRKDQE